MQDNAVVLNIRRFAILLILVSMPAVAQEAAPKLQGERHVLDRKSVV